MPMPRNLPSQEAFVLELQDINKDAIREGRKQIPFGLQRAFEALRADRVELFEANGVDRPDDDQLLIIYAFLVLP